MRFKRFHAFLKKIYFIFTGPITNSQSQTSTMVAKYNEPKTSISFRGCARYYTPCKNITFYIERLTWKKLICIFFHHFAHGKKTANQFSLRTFSVENIYLALSVTLFKLIKCSAIDIYSKIYLIRIYGPDFSISLGMIDRWSFGHLFTVVAVGVVQVIMLRRLFNVKPTSHKLSARAWNGEWISFYFFISIK